MRIVAFERSTAVLYNGIVTQNACFVSRFVSTFRVLGDLYLHLGFKDTGWDDIAVHAHSVHCFGDIAAHECK